MDKMNEDHYNNEEGGETNDELEKYFSNGGNERDNNHRHGKIWHDDYEGEPDEEQKPDILSL